MPAAIVAEIRKCQMSMISTLSAASFTDLSFVHHFEPGTGPGRRPLLLLHGTGGDEADLLPLGRALSPGSALLSPRGKVLENGMPRFFRRLDIGVFDEEDLIRRVSDLGRFVTGSTVQVDGGNLAAGGWGRASDGSWLTAGEGSIAGEGPIAGQRRNS